ncbi:peptidase s24-like domain-containing protein [Ditylenchus destructor]|uniref:Peptidase s24-like domain-containing protein n=1 Tax=Ditylenchus destructor TaxID=166010 RepID=A0AAD4MTW5_9BILA|nr:peptidase s24-like domain-containing protein [Ditylenchus destructor]
MTEGSLRRLFWKSARCAVYGFSASLVFGNHIGGFVYCEGTSMQPTIQHGDLLFVERLSVNWQNLHRGDIVAVLSPNDRNRLICKRLVCKEHDMSPSSNSERIPVGHCYVLGDNAQDSMDSRYFGSISLGLVQDRAMLRIWPISRFGWLTTHSIWEKEQ